MQSVAADRASDGRSAVAFLQRVLRINCDLPGDPSHDMNNDMGAGLRRADLCAFKTLLLACYNVQRGPWGEGARFAQALSGLDEVYEEDDAQSSPLFQALAPAIYNDLRSTAHSVAEDSIDDIVWNQLFFHVPWRKKYAKVLASGSVAHHPR